MCNVYISHYDKSIFFLFVYLNTISKIRKKQEKQMKKSLYTHGRQFKPPLYIICFWVLPKILKKKIKKPLQFTFATPFRCVVCLIFGLVVHQSGHTTLLLGTAMSRVALGAVSPNTSLVSSSLGFIPSGNCHVKQ